MWCYLLHDHNYYRKVIAGIGGGAINSLGVVIVSSKLIYYSIFIYIHICKLMPIVSLSDRGKYQSILITTFAISSGIGSLVDGAFTDHNSWHWVFCISLPIDVVPTLIILFWLRLSSFNGSIINKLRKIDYASTVFVSAATVCLLFVLSWGGESYSWPSSISILVYWLML
jgi:hypothetical protein